MVVNIPEPKLYPSGGVFIKYSPDGGSFAYYPSGRMAAAYEKMGSGFYCYFYADGKAGTTLLAIDPSGEGFCAFPNGSPRLTSRKQGGTYVDESGAIQRLWTTQKPLNPAHPIEFDLSPHLHVTFGSRQQIEAKLTCQGMTEDYQLGEVQKMATDSYLSKSLGMVKMGPERGKHILDIDKCRQAAEANRQRRDAMGMKDVEVAKTTITEDDMKKHPDLRPIVSSTASLKASVGAGDWDVDCFISKQKLIDTLGSTLPTLAMGASLKGDPHSRTFASLPATKPDVLEALVRTSEFDGRPLPLSKSIKAASGRYRPDHGIHYKTPRKKLVELTSRTFDTFLKDDAPNNALVVVCCLAGWLPQCRRTEPLLEMLNGKLQAKDGGKAHNYNQAIDAETNKPKESGPSGMVPTETTPAYLLRKFDMSESRFLQQRYNINTLPMYLMYYGGKLTYASSTLNGFGTSTDDLVAQVRESTKDAQRGVFLPEGFTFGKTSNKTNEDFQATLASTAPILGK